MRTVLIAVNIVVLAMPLAALGVFRIYDTELVRRTEAELVAQATYVSELYAQRLAATAGDEVSTIGTTGEKRWPMDPESGLRPIPVELRLSLDDARPPAEDARDTLLTARAAEIAAGREISETLRRAQRILLAGIRIVNPDGVVVGSTRGELGQSLAHREEVKRALAGEFVSFARERVSDSPVPGIESISRRTKIRIFVAMPIVVEGRIVGAVVTSRTPISLQKAAYDNRWTFSSLFLGLLVGVIIISLLTSVGIARPIRRLRDKVRALSNPSESLEMPAHPRTQELAELTRAFQDTTQSLRERERYLQTFARDVRHEFKTPLSSLRGAVELLNEHIDEMSPERRDKFLGNLMQDVARLESLTQDLLELAQADVAQSTDESCLVVDALARATRDDVELDARVPADLAVRLPVDALESVFRNLLGNVAMHGAGRATLTAEVRDDEVVLELEDTGPGFTEEMLGEATEAFVSTAKSKGGTGLGLSIVRGYVQAHGGDVEVTNREGAVVRLVLPRAEPDESESATVE